MRHRLFRRGIRSGCRPGEVGRSRRTRQDRAPGSRHHASSLLKTAGFVPSSDQARRLWLRGELSMVDRGSWTDPRAGQIRYGKWAEEWMAGLRIKPKTRAGYESLLNSRILPAFGQVKLSRIEAAMVRKWIAEMTAEGLSASRIKQARAVLRQSLEVARIDGKIGSNPVQGVKAPTARRREPVYLTVEQVTELARCAEAHQKGSEALVWFLAVTRAQVGTKRSRSGAPMWI